MEHGNDRPHCRWRLSSRSTGLSTVAGLRKLVTADDDPDLTYEIKNNVAAEIGRQLRKIHSLPTDKQLKHDHSRK